MLGLILAHVMFLGQAGMATQLLNAPAPAAAPTTQAAVPTSQPAARGMDGPISVADAFGQTTVGKLFSGEKKLTVQDLMKPEFWVDNIRELVMGALAFIPRIMVAMFFFVLFWGIYRGVRRVVVGSMGKAHVDQSIRDMMGHLIKWAIMGFGLVIACNQIGIQITALLTGVSIIGLAIGFAAQETLSNFIAGVVIFWDKPFTAGDWIEIDGTFGQVQRVTFRSTRLLTLDGEVIVLPNTHMLSTKVSNHSSNPVNRVNIPIGIAYKESIDKARAALLAATNGDSRLCQDPPPSVVVKECADSSVNLILRFWIRDESIERSIGYEYTEKAKKALDAAGIEIPFPHMQLFIENTPAMAAIAAGGNGASVGRVVAN